MENKETTHADDRIEMLKKFIAETPQSEIDAMIDSVRGYGVEPTPTAVDELDLQERANNAYKKSGSYTYHDAYIKGYTDHAQQSTAKYVGIVEGEIAILNNSGSNSKAAENILFGKIDILKKLLTKLKNS